MHSFMHLKADVSSDEVLSYCFSLSFLIPYPCAQRLVKHQRGPPKVTHTSIFTHVALNAATPNSGCVGYGSHPNPSRS